MKKIISIVLAMCMVLSVTLTAAAVQETKNGNITYREIKITLDGTELIPVDAAGNSVEPFIYNGTTYLPVRGIANALKLSVAWDAQTSTVTLSEGGTSIAPLSGAKASVGTYLKKIAYRDISIVLNGEKLVPKGTDGSIVEPFIIDGTTYLPVRAISEALKLSVNWNNDTNTVVLSKTKNEYKVLRVVDGDTIVIDYNGIEEKVRMIGIDTPESVHPDAQKNTTEGKTASEYTKMMLEGKNITLELDVQERDMYGRLLAYVYLNGVMFNKTLLENGYAEVSTYPPNVKYVDDFVVISNKVHNVKENTENSTAVKTSGNYVGSEESDKYHYPTCRYAEKIAEGNKIWFNSEEEAATAGYLPCGVCKP